jgi:N-methylhydantoinase B
VFIVNDPYLGGTHLMDVRFVKPFFYRASCSPGWPIPATGPDVGGMVPGGFSASATGVEQEGLRLPPVKFWKKGEMDQEILSIILSNIRIADQRIGDIKAQAAGLTTGEVRLTALIDRYGAEVVRQAIAEMRHRAERQMRAKIADIPDGVYEGTSQVDSDGVVDQPLTIKMKITKKGEDLLFDMTGSSRVPRADEQRHRHDEVGDLSRGEAHLPRRADQCRHVRAAEDRRARGHIPLCQVSATGLLAAPPK